MGNGSAFFFSPENSVFLGKWKKDKRNRMETFFCVRSIVFWVGHIVM